MTALVCATCRKPVERTSDDDFQHVSTDDGLACTAWPVVPGADTAREIGRMRAEQLFAASADENWLGI